MVLLTVDSKQYLFGAAGKRVSRVSTSTSKKSLFSSKTFFKIGGGNPMGMMMAAAQPSETPRHPSARSKTAPSKTAKHPPKKSDTIFKEVNKYGLMALSAVTLVNHSHNTFHKLSAAIQGDMRQFRLYEEKSKSYLKPHFSLPAQWNQVRTTFGTPWYY